ncbi:hypothetical protein Xlen_02545 [Xanthomonas campestris pv. leeana]|uniref:hypothetical protein n=1 Tax=Xanthomonas citri TaxID=346 RepID=UPI000297446C|nr:hypothetical protein [Xanthomonas citri]EKQ59896.1 hypothetical protein WS7_14699 [Xanthomonas citri pv. malvacearum str. GSPB2388]OOW63325.1 hypothetical protein Xths_02910 [Xanthomonas campestris pv. thespesiae]OOW78356.1 hypothetical protein Xlen_02545 [Xanthomonas campestris pv. leeana]
MSQSNGWATAQAPRFVEAPLQSSQDYVPPHKKREQADALRLQVEAHLAGGGAYEVITTPRPIGKSLAALALRSTVRKGS